jgi:hypothetical protein
VSKTLVVLAAVLLVTGCASTYYDPAPPERAQRLDLGTHPGRSLEEVYRLLFAQLSRCVGGGYHVQPRFDRDLGSAAVLLVQGLGLNRYSVVGNALRARVDLRATASGGTQVSLLLADAKLASLRGLVPAWLDGATTCTR